MAVSRPRVGLIYSRRQTETGSHCSRPEPERTVDVDPRPRGAGGRDDLLERVEGAGVDLSGLEGASDCQTVEIGRAHV